MKIYLSIVCAACLLGFASVGLAAPGEKAIGMGFGIMAVACFCALLVLTALGRKS